MMAEWVPAPAVLWKEDIFLWEGPALSQLLRLPGRQVLV